MGREAQDINRENCTLEELERSMKCTRTYQDSLRLMAVSFLYRGYERETVVEMLKVGESSIRRWISAFNKRGIDGIVTRPRSGRPRAIAQEVFESEHLKLIESPENHGFDFMTAVRLHGYLTEQLGITVSYTSVLRNLHKAGFCLKVPGKTHPDRDEQARARFVEEMQEIVKRTDEYQVWFTDECGIDGDPRTGRAWFRKGSKPKVHYDGCHLRQSVIGAIEPNSGAFEALAVPYTDTSVFQIFVDTLAKRTQDSDKVVLLVLDNASWHHAASIHWHHITPKYLPAYSPDLNPIERIWLELKNKYFTNWYTRDPVKLLERTCCGLKSLMLDPARVSSICAIPY